MINVRVVVRNIDYDKTVAGVYPLLMEKCKEMEGPPLPVRFLLKMGHTARKAVCGILCKISDDTMGEVLCGTVWKYNQQILKKLNEFLEKYKIAKVGGISVTEGVKGQIALNLWDIQVDYKGFVHSSMGSQIIRNFAKQHMGMFSGAVGNMMETGAKVVSGFMPKFEKFMVSQLEKEKYKRKILESLYQFLESYQISLTLVEISFGYGSNIKCLESQEMGQISFYHLQEEVLDKVVEYMKQLIE